MSLSTMCCLPATFWGRRVSWRSVICSIFCKLEISLRYLRTHTKKTSSHEVIEVICHACHDHEVFQTAVVRIHPESRIQANRRDPQRCCLVKMHTHAQNFALTVSVSMESPSSGVALLIRSWCSKPSKGHRRHEEEKNLAHPVSKMQEHLCRVLGNTEVGAKCGFEI